MASRTCTLVSASKALASQNTDCGVLAPHPPDPLTSVCMVGSTALHVPQTPIVPVPLYVQVPTKKGQNGVYQTCTPCHRACCLWSHRGSCKGWFWAQPSGPLTACVPRSWVGLGSARVRFILRSASSHQLQEQHLLRQHSPCVQSRRVKMRTFSDVYVVGICLCLDVGKSGQRSESWPAGTLIVTVACAGS